MKATAAELAEALKIAVPDAPGWHDEIASVVIDSRNVRPGSLFVCIKGEKTDGHIFARAAEEQGACAFLAEKELPGVKAPVLVVPNVIKALGKLAAWWREKSSATVICITGTAGKTTLKEALRAIFDQAGPTAATEKNLNNQIGLPLTILDTTGHEKFLIVEAGISHAGDMDELGQIAQPDIALIINVGPGHCAGLGDAGVAWNKARLLKYLAPNGWAIISADYPELAEACSAYAVKKKWFSSKPDLDADFCVVEKSATGGQYAVQTDHNVFSFATPFQGAYGAELTCAAVACAMTAGLEPAWIEEGFKATRLPKQRFALEEHDGWLVIDDTYNANPLSMQRMLETAAGLASDHALPLVAVLGEMGELGAEASARHHELGKQLAGLGPVAIFWKGDFASEVAKGRAGLSDKFYECQTSTDFIDKLATLQLPQKGVIIFKGSHSNHLEDYLAAFKNKIFGEQSDVL